MEGQFPAVECSAYILIKLSWSMNFKLEEKNKKTDYGNILSSGKISDILELPSLTDLAFINNV